MRRLPLLAALLLLVPAAAAQSFSTSNLQVLYGTGFNDWYYGNNTTGEEQATLTFEHFTAFAYGDVFFFADLTAGEFAGPEGEVLGQENRIYSELAVRLSPLRLAGVERGGPLRDVLVAGQVNRDGTGFAADMIGLGLDLDLPAFAAAGLNVYYRDDLFNAPTWQLTATWLLPFTLAGLDFSLNGFLDVYGTDDDGADIHTQPQLLVEVPGAPLACGLELYVHENRRLTTVAPQAMVRWTL